MNNLPPTSATIVYKDYRSGNIEQGNESIEVTPIKRWSVAVKADRFGSIPVIGTVVGVARFVFGLLAAWTFLIGSLCARLSGNKDLVEARLSKADAASCEFMRGLFELVPGMINHTDSMFQENKEEEPPLLFPTSIARGHFLYRAKERRFYTEEAYPSVKLVLSSRYRLND
ncbi:MAG: hypothetical protein KGJ02_02700 [Verrucomicrobiota bacterium]|nr:hypothetical protein [Verrucomicrobiota bacterium]